MKTYGLQRNSKNYYSNSSIYERFSQAEDYPGKIEKELIPLIKGKKILDIGCGTGKYLKILAPHCSQITGIDISTKQLEIAKSKIGKYENITLINGQVERINHLVSDRDFDVVIGCWFLDSAGEYKTKQKIVNRTLSVLKKGGLIILVENGENGEFEEIRERVDDPLERTRKYNNWLINRGFCVRKKITSYFRFKNISEALSVFGAIWGFRAIGKISKRDISHNIIIFEKLKR